MVEANLDLGKHGVFDEGDLSRDLLGVDGEEVEVGRVQIAWNLRGGRRLREYPLQLLRIGRRL